HPSRRLLPADIRLGRRRHEARPRLPTVGRNQMGRGLGQAPVRLARGARHQAGDVGRGELVRDARYGGLTAGKNRVRTSQCHETSPSDSADFLRHEHAGGPRWITWNAAELPPAMALVKSWSLEVDRIEDGSTAAAPHRLFLRHAQHARADLAPAQALREEY